MKMNWNSLQPRLRRIAGNRAFRSGAIALVLYALAGFLLLPYLVEHYVPKYARDTLQRQASVAAVRFNPFLFKLEADDFRLQESDGQPIAAVRRLLIDFELSSLFRWAWTFADIRLDGLDMNIVHGADGRLNLVELARSFPTSEKPRQPDAEPVRMLLSHIAVVNSAVIYSDLADGEAASTTLKPVNFELEDVTTLPERDGAFALSAELPDNGSVYVQGVTRLRPFTVTGDISIQGFRPAAVWKFLTDKLRLAEPQGEFVFQSAYRFALMQNGAQLELKKMQLHVAGLDVREPDAQTPLLALKTLEVKNGQFDLAKRELTLPHIGLHAGQIGMAIAKDGTVNWQTLAVRKSAAVAHSADGAAQTAAQDDKPWHIRLGAVDVGDVAVQATDRSRATPLALDVGQLTARLDADIAAGGPASAVSVNAAAIDLARLSLKPLGEAEPLATLAQIKLEQGRVDTAARSIGIGRILLRDGATRIERDEQGNARLFEALADARPGKIQSMDKSGPAWRFKLDTLQLEALRVALVDLSLEPALQYDLEDITATLTKVSNDPQTPVGFETGWRYAQGGSFGAKGSFLTDGTRLDARMSSRQVALEPLRALLARHAALDLRQGNVSAEIDLEYRQEGREGKDEPSLRATGTAHIDDLLIHEEITGDRFLAWQTLTADGIAYASGSGPAQLSIKDMRLVAPRAKVEIFEDRSVNLGKVFDKKAAATKESLKDAADSSSSRRRSESQRIDAAETSSDPVQVKVARVRVEKGIVFYSDHSLVLPFAAQIRDFQGTATGISSARDSRARLEFEGRVEDYGSAKVSGALSPFSPKHFTDIRTTFRNIAMPPLSPYSATFAGRKIAEGKLSLDLEYKIDDGALAGDNKILLEQFTLGERVDSPDALDLPLDLAVALLTDSRGRIDVAVPVSGDMNKPTFSLGGVIGQAVVRMLTRIVTAPFSALGNLFGGGDKQANAIAFDPGSDRLTPPQQEKLAKVGKALHERPQLKVMVGGRYDPKRDGAALRAVRVRRELAAELDIKLAPDEAPGPVAFEQAQTQRALENLLEARAGGKAIDEFQGRFEQRAGKPVERVNPVLALIGQESPDHAFYEALFEHLVEIHPLAEADLHALAQRRSESVVQALVDAGGIDRQRVGAAEIASAEKNRDNAVETVLSLDVYQPSSK
ncbi:MAG TPA: DUF748 domain-containing protein [Gammaproteobacteria bacterium]